MINITEHKDNLIQYLNMKIAMNIDKPIVVEQCLKEIEIAYKKILESYKNDSFQ